MKNNPLPRLDLESELREQILPHCRLRKGEIWSDLKNGHRVGCLDATEFEDVSSIMAGTKATLAIQDPPYNVAALDIRSIEDYVKWCEIWVQNTTD
ncbi:MAG: site-specific DNA-methyltransferase, partial [Gammaproteobacteria bacterium]|nr:site-specific DNA-methyltransferase [Gammaproteobacteria bacterium]